MIDLHLSAFAPRWRFYTLSELTLTSPGRMLYDSACKTAAQVVNILKVEHTLPLRDGVCSTNAQIRDGNIYLVIRKSGTTVTPHLYSLERFFW